MAALLNLTSRLPVAAWLDENTLAHDLSFRDDLLDALEAGDLVVLDRGYVSHTSFSTQRTSALWMSLACTAVMAALFRMRRVARETHRPDPVA